MDKKELYNQDCRKVEGIAKKLNGYKEKHPDHVLIGLNDVKEMLDKSELTFFESLFDLSLLNDADSVIKERVKAFSGQRYVREGKEEEIPTQYVSVEMARVLEKLRGATKEDLGKEILVESAYRSPIYQALLFVWFIDFFECDMDKTFERVVFPGESEHNLMPDHAVDFMTVEGVPTEEEPLEFADTSEYAWLKERAGEFNLVESYPNLDNDGIAYEPWHWRLSS